jgi:hypothetical protein
MHGNDAARDYWVHRAWTLLTNLVSASQVSAVAGPVGGR